MSFTVRTDRVGRMVWIDGLVAAAVAMAAAIALMASAPVARAAAPAMLDGVPPGTIVVKQSERRLYLTLGDGQAIAYDVAVGKPGKQWHGVAQVDGKYVDPAWAPPAEVKRAEPWLPSYIAGGAPNNPMGHRALTLTGGEYAIHGTNRPWTVGTAASFGCIRMREADIEDLFERVEVGTPVVMVR
jgi:lipoprotein-anchoring transpeptidase ErfK/SrfK